MAKKKSTKPTDFIKGLVTLRGKHAVADEKGNITEVGISLASQDDQEVILEIAVKPEFADSLKFDSLYHAMFAKGKGITTFKVVSLIELPTHKYDEKMVIDGDLRGHLHLNIKPEQEDFFAEGLEYSLELSEVEG